ncbi:MAG: LytTR family DNA-binding domain-containing protein [Clostridia bacterium]
MIKIGMCDDNLITLQPLQTFLESEFIEQNFDAEIDLVTTDQHEIYKQIINKQIDILFLDIDFKNGGKNGLEFARDLRKYNKDFYLIFISAHQRYMHISFFAKVFDYLVKPINRAIVQDLVCRLKDEFEVSNNIFLHLNRWISVRVNDILYIEKLGNKSIIYTKSETLESTKTLESLIEKLPNNFRKSHRSYIINTDKVYCIDKKDHFVYFSKELRCPINSHFEI